MAVSALNVVVELAGTSTAFTNEPTNKLVSNTVYQLQTAARRLLDPAVALTVEVDADGAGGGGYAVAAPSTYSVDYLFGKITFTADQGASALVRVSGNYLPVHPFVEARGFDINEMRELLDDTVFGDAARSRMAGIQDANGSIEQLDLGETDLDAGAGTLKILTTLRNGTAKLLEVDTVGDGTDVFRAWVLFKDRGVAGRVPEIIPTTFNWELAAQTGVTASAGNRQAKFAWGAA